MNVKSTIGLAALALTSCSRFSGCFSKHEAAPAALLTPAFSEVAQEQAHLVSAYLITKGVRYKNIYGQNYPSQDVALTIGYHPEGKTGDYADDTLLAAFESSNGFSVLYYDGGVNGTPDIISDIQDATPVIPLEVYSPEDQQVHVDFYRKILSSLEETIRKTEDGEALKKVEPL